MLRNLPTLLNQYFFFLPLEEEEEEDELEDELLLLFRLNEGINTAIYAIRDSRFSYIFIKCTSDLFYRTICTNRWAVDLLVF